MSLTVERAHATLGEPANSCCSCHADEAETRARQARYASARKLPTPTRDARLRVHDDRAIAALAVGIALAGSGFVAWNERRLRRDSTRKEMR